MVSRSGRTTIRSFSFPLLRRPRCAPCCCGAPLDDQPRRHSLSFLYPAQANAPPSLIFLRFFFCSPSSVELSLCTRTRLFSISADRRVVSGTVVVYLLPVQYIMVRHCHHSSTHPVTDQSFTQRRKISPQHIGGWPPTFALPLPHTHSSNSNPGIGGTPASPLWVEGEASKTETKFFSSSERFLFARRNRKKERSNRYKDDEPVVTVGGCSG